VIMKPATKAAKFERIASRPATRCKSRARVRKSLAILAGMLHAARLARMLIGALPVLSILSGAPAQADVIRLADMRNGVQVKQAQCAARPKSVWVTVAEQSVCIRYYISTVGGRGSKPVVYLSGDKLGPYDWSTNTFQRPDEFKDIDSRDLQRIADLYSAATGTTAIYLARVGIDGSSGFHGVKTSLLEVNLLNAALDAIKQRHHLTGFSLVGQGGGATNIGGLLGLRTDLLCAVLGSARLAPDAHELERPLGAIVAVNYVPTIVQNRGTRIIVLTDPEDQQVPAAQQTPFVEAMRKAAGRVEQFFVYGYGEKHHNVTNYVLPAVAGCIDGASHGEIAAALRDVAARMK
jgi:hypothetical protein